MLAESAGGDIRASINALQFSCLQDATTTNSYSEIFQVRGWVWSQTSVADPNPDPEDPYVFGSSGSISQRYGSGAGSGTGSFYQK
jgi:hypothetical protein